MVQKESATRKITKRGALYNAPLLVTEISCYFRLFRIYLNYYKYYTILYMK